MSTDQNRSRSSRRGGSNLVHAEITDRIIRAAFQVSNSLGCGFLEKVYENALAVEL